MELEKKSLFTVSNFLSLLRILLVFPTVYFISTRENELIYYIAFVAMLSDWLATGKFTNPADTNR